MTIEEQMAVKRVQFLYPPRLVEAGGLLLLLDDYDQVCEEIGSELDAADRQGEESDSCLSPKLALLESVIEDSDASLSSTIQRCRSRLKSDLWAIFESHRR